MVKLQLDESASTSLDRKKKRNNSLVWPIRVPKKRAYSSPSEYTSERFQFTNCAIFGGALVSNTSH